MSDLRNAIRSMIDLPPGALTGEVKTVDKSARLCTVTTDGLDVPNVRLRAASGDGDGMVLLPKVGSTVVIAPLENLDTMYYLAMFSEVDELLLVVGGFSFSLSADGLATEAGTAKLVMSSAGLGYSKGADDLKGLLSDLLTQLQALTVTCTAPGSPSSPPINNPALLTLSTRLNLLLTTP